MKRRTNVKIAYIGGGSKGWARCLMSDLALLAEFDGTLSLYDIDRAAAARNERLGRAVFQHPQARARFEVEVASSAESALKGSDFVVMSIEPGPTRMRYADIEIPRRYGILQPVADTVGPGGLMRALRSIPVYADYGRLILKHCPGAWVINYTNPMTLCTAALHAAAPGIKAFGCCHEVYGIQDRLAELVSGWFNVPKPDWREIALDVAGVNHFTFATAAAWRGHDLFPRLRRMVADECLFRDRSAVARRRAARGEVFTSDGLVSYDFMRRFGALGAAGDRHLAEFVPWYLDSEKNLHRWGVVLTTYAWRLEDLRRRRHTRITPAEIKARPMKRSWEQGVDQMNALLGFTPLVSNVNLPNRGQMTQVPEGAVVETYAHLTRDEARPVVARPMPPAIAEWVRRTAANQSLVLQAALTKDVDLAFQALLNDPLVRLQTGRAWLMFREMLEHTRSQLPGWKI